MAKDLKTTWKETGKGLGTAFRDLGKALIKTGSTALNKADAWANKEDHEPEQASEEKAEVKDEENN